MAVSVWLGYKPAKRKVADAKGVPASLPTFRALFKKGCRGCIGPIYVLYTTFKVRWQSGLGV